MVSFKYLASACFLVATLVSCDSYLDTPPVGALTPEGFYKTEAQSEQGILGVYADLNQIDCSEFWNLAECRSDNTWVEPNPNGYRYFSAIGTFKAGDDTGQFNTIWNAWYKLIYDANTALQKIPGSSFDDENLKQQLLNEAYFLRGWAYFELVRLFGRVPIVDKPVGPSVIKSVSQSEAMDVINKIVIPDLTKATSLPYRKDMKDANGKSIYSQGRADKLTAKAMLARVYTTLAGFPFNDTGAKTEAKNVLEDVLNDAQSKQYWAPTLDEWRKQWLPTSAYYNKYAIFSIQHRSGGTGNTSIFNMLPVANLPASWTKWTFGGNSIYVEKSLMYEFDKVYSNGEKDGRGYGFSVLESIPGEGTVMPYESPKESLKLEDGSSVDVYSRAMFYKYVPTKTKIAALGLSLDVDGSMINKNDWGVNFPVIRLEDMQLLYAEILAEEGQVDKAMTYVNNIRTRANCDPVSSAGLTSEKALEYIRRERRIELMGEGVRWFDEVRYGTWKTDIENKFDRYNFSDLKANVKDGRYLFPIPLAQLEITPGLYQQNAGY